MNNQYTNPHLQQQQLMLRQQLQQQQQMLNQQQQQYQQPQQQFTQQQIIGLLQQNPQILNALLQQPQQQPQYQPQQPLQTNQRFNQTSGSNQGSYQQQAPVMPAQRFEETPGCSRYGGKEQQEEKAEPEALPLSRFTVSPKPTAVPLTTKLSITPKVTAFSDKTLSSIQEVCYSFSLEDAVEELITVADKTDDSKMFYTIDSVILNEAFKVPFDPGYVKLFSDDVKALYKRLRGLYEAAVTMDTVIMLERVDKLMTEMTNHYLKINFEGFLAIDRFSTDFNDLLKILRTNYEDEEDDLWEYLSKEILEIYNLLAKEENKKLEFSIVKPTTLVYFNEHHLKMGLKGVTHELVVLTTEESNTFLNTVGLGIADLCDRTSFYVVTYDRNIYRFSVNKKKEVLVELVN